MAAELDRAKEGLAVFVRRLFARVDYFALYPSKVVAQNADGTLELRPDSDRLPGLSKVPVRLGVPGSVKVSGGARVLLGFEEGDPGRPIATLWETRTVIEIRLGDGTMEPAALGTTLKNWIGTAAQPSTLLGWLATLVLPTAVGPAGPPQAPPPILPTIESATVKVEV